MGARIEGRPVITVIGLVLVTAAMLAAVRAIDTPERAASTATLHGPRPAPDAPTATLAPVQVGPWTIGHAGLAGPSAWLTAPRETESFAARRAAIRAAYQAADMPVAAVLAAAGWPIGG